MVAQRLAVWTVELMKKNKTWKTVTDIGGVVMAVGMVVAGWYAGVLGILIVWAVVRSILGRSQGGGIIGVDQQGQAHGRPKDEGKGGVGYQTFVPPSHR